MDASEAYICDECWPEGEKTMNADYDARTLSNAHEEAYLEAHPELRGDES
jgi:hypothetical protein